MSREHLCSSNPGETVCKVCGADEPPPWPRIARKIDAEMRDLCHHCGKPPEADGDHSCPCPYSDDECPNHHTGAKP